MDWALNRVNPHLTELEGILHIVERNPDICFVGTNQPRAKELDLCPIKEDCYLWTAHGFNAKCARPTTVADRRDYASIFSQMAEIPIYGLQVHRHSDSGMIGSIEFGIYEGSLIPWRHPISGVWSSDNHVYMTGCRHAAARGWFVCEHKMNWWL